MPSGIPLGVYFYPQTTTCLVRAERADRFGRQIVDETELVQHATPLFAGHRQPRTYCLGEPHLTRWDDADPQAMGLQVELMEDAGIDFVIFDTYGGSKNGALPNREMDKPHNTFLSLGETRKNIQFATMWCRSGPRVDLPAPLGLDRSYEPGREYDQSVQTARFIIDQCATRYWGDPNHFRVKDRPYLSIYNTYSPVEPQVQDELKVFMHTLKAYALSNYGTEPYVVAVERQTHKTSTIGSAGLDAIDAVSAYAMLPDLTHDAASIQSYPARLATAREDWEHVTQSMSLPFVPPAVVGWDASARGMPNARLEDVAGKYPYTPILTDGTPELFGNMLSQSLDWVQAHVPPSEQYGLICSWNEIGEGCTLLPEVIDGKADFSYLKATAKAINTFRGSR